MRVLLAQLPSAVGDVEANLSALEETVRGHVSDLAVFPELYLTGYNARDLHREIALELGGKPVERLKALAAERRTWILTGATTGSAEGPRNTALLVAPDGTVGRYDKIHLPTFSVFEEGLFFKPGRDVVVAPGPDDSHLGLSICYDAFFPELTKTQALRGADVLVNISASPAPSRPYFEGVLATRALECTAWVVYVNLVGVQDHLVFWGGSRVIDPFGKVAHQMPLDEPGVAVVEVRPELVRDARSRRPYLRDTRLTS